eukprot:scaffold103555_cov22-Tisochrysis_lutea.AAC.1
MSILLCMTYPRGPAKFQTHTQARMRVRTHSPRWCNVGSLFHAAPLCAQFRTSTLNSKAPEFIPSYVRAAQQQQQQGSSSSRGSTVPG